MTIIKENTIKATLELMKEHDGIMLMLNIMNRITENIQKKMELNTAHVERVIEFLKVFADQLEQENTRLKKLVADLKKRSTILSSSFSPIIGDRFRG